MRSTAWRIALFATAIAMGFTFAVASKATADETPNCATHNEWEDVTVFMLPGTVADIIGNNGDFVDTDNPETFARRYNLCWTDNVGKVWYDQDSRLSFRKDII